MSCLGPLLYAFIGWFTNWLAIKMLFYPEKFIGIGITKPVWLQIGWQGVIPRHAIKVTSMISKILKEELLKPSDLYKRIEPHQMVLLLSDYINNKSEKIISLIMEKYFLEVWNLVPDFAKNFIFSEVNKKVLIHIENLYYEFGKYIDQVIDFDPIIYQALTGKNTHVLIEVFQKSGKQEFQFIIKSGFWFGLLIGILQLGFYHFFTYWWIMPLTGIIVGYITNWLALQMIFRPLEPRRFIWFYYQGLLLKRQIQSAWELAEILEKRIFNPENLITLFFEGKSGELLSRIIMQEIQQGFRELESTLLFSLLVSSQKREQIQKEVIENFLQDLPTIYPILKKYFQHSIKIKETFARRLASLPPEEYEKLFHQIFQEEEMTLILLGAVIGGIMGVLQVIL